MSTQSAPPAGAAEPMTESVPRGPVTSASYSITVRLTADGDPASIGRIATAVGSAGGAVTAPPALPTAVAMRPMLAGSPSAVSRTVIE